MNNVQFTNENGLKIPSVDEKQMREVDRIAVEDFGLGILHMMENAGRNLAKNIIDLTQNNTGKVISVVAGSGGNGGGGLCSARHLHNHGYQINLMLTKAPEDLTGAAGIQFKILQKSGISPIALEDVITEIRKSDIVIDAIIGYSLKGAPQGIYAEYINLINQHAKRVLSLDLPSGVNASTGATPGVFISAERTLTLALPKQGLKNPAAGEIFLADIGIPPEVYSQIGIELPPIFTDSYCYRLLPEN
jgi:NAD(P)H-hydrate epimerase